MLSSYLLEILACPVCKGGLVLSPGERGLVCRPCALEYPIRDGIPVLLVDEAHRIAGAAGEAGRN